MRLDHCPFDTLKLLLVLLISGLSVACTVDNTAADNSTVLHGRYGFDWLSSDSQCIAITDEIANTFAQCRFSDSCTFGGQSTTCYICSADNNASEYRIYQDRATCDDQHDTMMANG